MDVKVSGVGLQLAVFFVFLILKLTSDRRKNA